MNSICFSGGQKTNIFNYKNDRFGSFFDRNQNILDLDTNMYEFHTIYKLSKNEHFVLQKCSILIVFWSKSENPRFGYENVRIPYDFQSAKKEHF